MVKYYHGYEFHNFWSQFSTEKKEGIAKPSNKKANGKQNEMENRIYTCLINLTASKRLQIGQETFYNASVVHTK